ncbi:condensation domain-containing protein [Streptomyces sp. NPDC028635]|uniref:condensation domain-containing protein n=1 Tax=Streptomyces sp. NPDC028635 TaxID=3154800 RepID=UPI00340950E4
MLADPAPPPARGAVTPPVSLAQRERLTLWASGQPSQDQPTFAWSFAGAVDTRRARAAWHAVVARYDTLRSVFEDTGAGTFTCRRDGATAITAQTFAVTSPQDFLGVLCAPLALIGGALARLVVSPGADETLIGLSIDHLVIDGHSYHRVVADFFSLLRGEEPAGPPPAPADAFFHEELKAADSAAARKVLDYWRRTTGGTTYPPLHPDLARPAGVTVAPETAHTTVAFDPGAPYARTALGRSARVLAAVSTALLRVLEPADRTAPLRFLLQSSRRSSPEKLNMAGFLSNWQVTSFTVGGTADDTVHEVTQAVFRSLRGHPLHHAEVVRRLEPRWYGARYLPSEPLPPYALFNYLTEQEPPRIGGRPGRALEIPPMGAYRLHGALRVYGTERADGSGAAVRLVADASVFGAGLAASLAEAVSADPGPGNGA